MSKSLRFIGLDVHKDSIVIAVAEEGRDPASMHSKIPNDWGILKKTLTRLGRRHSLRCCYEAGPCGYGLYRRMNEAKIDCVVVAPSLIPVQSGNRIKTDRRDAKKLAHFLRSGDLTTIFVPDEEAEALRDLERARQDAKKAERVARQQLGNFLLRHGRRWEESNWTQRHRDWIRRQKFDHQAQQRVLVDLQRFSSPGQLMAFLGLVPSEHSSGETRNRGKITRTGNKHVRRILVEAAWSYQFHPNMSKAIRQRNQGVAPTVQGLAWKAQKRLHRRLYHLLHKGKSPQKAITAVARELSGFIWAVGQQPTLLAEE